MKKLIIIAAVLISLVCGSCKKYLSEAPRVQADIKTAEQLRALLDNPSSFITNQGDDPLYNLVNDQNGITTDLYSNNKSYLTTAALYAFTFDMQGVSSQPSDLLWNACYAQIFKANVVLSTIDNVSGDEALKRQVKADAYFDRAYANWLLVNYYCQPYATANLTGLGLPLKKTTNYEESLTRATLKETYDFIIADVLQAQSLTDYTDVQPSLRFRVSKPAIDAFLSRFYLFTGDYAKCIQSANSALASSAVQLVDYNTIPAGTPATYSNPAATLTYAALNDYASTQFLVWPEMFYARFAYTSSQNIIPNNNILSLYDQANDLRYKHFFIPNGGRRFGIVTPETFRYTMFNDGRYSVAGPSLQEVLLNKAEASARTNDLAGALAAVNAIRAKRYKAGATSALAFVDQADAIAKVLEERRRELPFAFRFVDIRRFSVNSDPSDDVTISHTFFKITNGVVDVNTIQTYTLKKSNLLWPINQTEINNSHGQIQQNTFQ